MPHTETPLTLSGLFKFLGCFFVIACFITCVVLCIVFAPAITKTYNNWRYGIQKADDESRYSTRKSVEDQARAMIASYNKDKLMYHQYRDATDAEERSWGMQAKNRANNTASTYNNFVLTNSFVWKDNIPPDIFSPLAIIE
jgi:hypothetical protein